MCYWYRYRRDVWRVPGTVKVSPDRDYPGYRIVGLAVAEEQSVDMTA